MKIEQTKGTFKLNGKSNVEKFTTKDLGWMNTGRMNIKTLKDNFVNVVFEQRNGRGLDVAIKAKGDEKSHKVGIADAVDEVKCNFTNDDMLFVVGVVDYDTYRKEFVLKPTGVFHSGSDYDNEDFEETNFAEQEFIFDSFNGKVAKLYIVSYFGEIIEVEMKVDEDLVEDFKSFKTGDFIKAVFSLVNKPIYVDSEDEESKPKGKYVPKGKGVGNKGGNKKKVDGYDTYNIIVGIEDVESGKFTRKDIREQQEEYERQQEEYNAKRGDTSAATQDDADEDLPY